MCKFHPAFVEIPCLAMATQFEIIFLTTVVTSLSVKETSQLPDFSAHYRGKQDQGQVLCCFPLSGYRVWWDQCTICTSVVTTLLLKKQPEGDCSFAPTAISMGSAKPSRRRGCDHPGGVGMMLTISACVRVP